MVKKYFQFIKLMLKMVCICEPNVTINEHFIFIYEVRA